MRITAPSNGAIVSGGITINTEVSSAVLWENLFIDGEYLASSPPYTFTWDASAVVNGPHTISAKAYAADGQELESFSSGFSRGSSISVNVANGATVIVSPANGASVSERYNATKVTGRRFRMSILTAVYLRLRRLMTSFGIQKR